MVDYITPFNTGLDNAAKNLNNIDAAKLNNIGTSVGNVGTELGNISKVVKDLEGANINFKGGMIQGVMGTPGEINSTNKSVSNIIPIAGKFNDTVKNSANSMKVTSEELERLKRNSPAIAAALNKQADAAKGLADGTSQAAKATTAFSKATTALKTIGNVTVWIALATAIGLAINKVIDYVSSIRTAAKEQEEFRKSITDATNQISSKSIAIFKELQIAYERVGDSADDKRKFIEQYSDKIKETGLNITDVKTAEDAFVNNTGNYVEALEARAKAQAIEQAAIKLYEEYLNKRTELENQISDTSFGEVSAWQAFKATAMF